MSRRVSFQCTRKEDIKMRFLGIFYVVEINVERCTYVELRRRYEDIRTYLE